MGAKYFFSATFGYSDEPLFETSEESASYSKLGVGAGLAFPIFGTWNKQKISALESEIRSIRIRVQAKDIKTPQPRSTSKGLYYFMVGM